MNRYTLKVEYADAPGVYRCIEIDGDKKLSHLAKQILDAFSFTDEHLYMFSVTRKMYDPDGYYAPGAGGSKKAAGTSLDMLGLSVRRKILFLYDFGEDWCFTITVKKKEVTDKKRKTMVTEAEGELEQYPEPEDWDEDWDEDRNGWDDEWDDEEELEDDERAIELGNILAECSEKIGEGLYLVDGHFSMQELREMDIEDEELPFEDLPHFYSVWKKDILNQEIWNTHVPAGMKWLVIQLQEKKITDELLIEQEMYCGFLSELGLLAIGTDEINQSVTVIVIKELKEIAAFLKDNAAAIEREKVLEEYTTNLLRFYSVIELSSLADILQRNFGMAETKEYLFEHVIRPLQDMMLLHVVTKRKGCFISAFEEEFTKDILRKIDARKKNGKYKELSSEEIAALKAGNFESIVSETMKLFQNLFSSRKFDVDFLEEFMERFSTLSRIGLQKTVFYEELGDFYEELGGEKGRFAKQIEKARKQYPTAAYMGYSMEEVGRIENDVFRQASLFDDELPF